MQLRTLCFALILVMGSALGQKLGFGVGPRSVTLVATVGQPIDSHANIGIVARAADGSGPFAVKFKYTGVTLANPNYPMPPNFVVVSPASGTTPGNSSATQGIIIGLNESVVRQMKTGTHSLEVHFSTVDHPEPAEASLFVHLRLTAPAKAPTISKVVNSASLQPSLSAGALVSIFGANFGPPVPSTSYDETGTYPTSVQDATNDWDYTAVRFNGIEAPLLSVSLNRIDAIVPYELAGQGVASVEVICRGRAAEAVTIPLDETAPAIFTATLHGKGQGAIRNFSYTTGFSDNSVDTPAEKGDVIEMLATGFGGYDPPVSNAALNLVDIQPKCAVTLGGNPPECRRLIAEPISLTIGGKVAKISYVGPARYQPYSRIRITAWVPEDADSGEQPLVVTVGQRDNSQQQVTIAIR